MTLVAMVAIAVVGVVAIAGMYFQSRLTRIPPENAFVTPDWELLGIERTQSGPPIREAPSAPVHVFYSYSHRDEGFRNELDTHLKLLERQGLIQSWNDRRISAGDEWKGQVDENLERADIILLLVSPDFFASNYCYDIEMERALARHHAGEARLIPVIVRDVHWHSAPFGVLQPLPKDGKAVNTWPCKDTAWRNVAEGIEEVVREFAEARTLL